MFIPQVTFNETNVGSRPIQPNLRNRIGIVGQFSRGPANVFSYVDGFTEFANVYGSDSKSGSVGYQAAWDQGPRDFGIVRVLGHGASAKGKSIIAGTAQKDNTLTLSISGVRDLTLESATVFDMRVTNAGSNYTGKVDGYYVSVVTAIDAPAAGLAEVKYIFVPTATANTRLEALRYVTPELLNSVAEPAPNKTRGVFYIAYNTALDTSSYSTAYPNLTLIGTGVNTTGANKAVNIGNGISLKYGTFINEKLYLKLNQKFSFEVESFSYEIKFNQGETAVDILNRILSTLQGADPLGNVTLDVEYLENEVDNYRGTLIFELDQNIDAVRGSKGSKYSYTWNLEQPDGLVYLNNAAWDFAAGDHKLYTTDTDAQYLVANDTLSFLEGGTNSSLNSTVKVVSVNANIPSPGIYEILLDEPLGNSGADGAAVGPYPLKISFTSASQSGFQVSDYQQTKAFVGGTDGPVNASRIFYSLTGRRLIEISAASPGAWGNNLLIDIVPITNSSYRINVANPDGNSNFNPPIVNESFIIDLTKTDALDNKGVITALNDSYLIRGSFLPAVDNPTGFDVNLLQLKPERLAPVNTSIAGSDTSSYYHPSYFGTSKLRTISLERGYNGPNITEDDYIQAVKALSGVNVNYICMPGIYTNFKKAQVELVTVAENSSELDGLKIAILNSKPKLRPNQAAKEFEHINSQRAVLITGWSTYAGQSNLDPLSLSPDVLYAGKLATIGFTVSPAARSTAGPVRNITEVDTRNYVSQSSLQAYTDGRMEVLFPESNLGGNFFLTGRTSSSDTAWDRIVIRRTYDVIRQDLFSGLQPYKSEPHTTLLRRQIETSVNAYFSNLARNGKIANFGGALCNNSNNPPENYVNGQVNVSVRFLPLYAADYINITITRDTESGLQIGVS